MQIIFYTERSAEDFSKKDGNIFPQPPQQCPFKDCSLKVNFKKHGYYERYYISKTFTGIVYIRRYICPICGKTVSMLPVFCIPKFQYSYLDIVDFLHQISQGSTPLKQYVMKLREYFPDIDRRHINYYKKRALENRNFIQFGLNLISPEFINVGSIPENQNWVKEFLDKVHAIQPRIFHVDFHQKTGKSFLTLQNIVA